MCPAVCVGLGLLLAFHWDTWALWKSSVCGTPGLMEELHRWDHRFLDFCSLLSMKGARVYLTDQHSSAKWGGFLSWDHECLFSVSPDSTARLFTAKCVFLPETRGRLRFQPYLPLMLVWKTRPLWLLAKISVCRFPSPPHQDSQAVLFAFRARPVWTVNWTGRYEILI